MASDGLLLKVSSRLQQNINPNHSFLKSGSVNFRRADQH